MNESQLRHNRLNLLKLQRDSTAFSPFSYHDFSGSDSGTNGLFSNSLRTLSPLDVDGNSTIGLSIIDTNSSDVHSTSKADVLFLQFLEILKTRSSDAEIFETIQSYAVICSTIVEELEREIQHGESGAAGTRKRQSNIAWLKEEINTWKLLNVLYHDRIMVQADSNDDELSNIIPTLGASEKEIISQLYNVNATLREYQLIVDWLEKTYERPDGIHIAHTSDRTVAWENTLFQLKNKETVYFSKTVDIVHSLDPDAPIREQLPLHALDEEDNQRLSRCIFTEIRSGNFDKATSLCKHFGQTWRAAILEGWRLHEDPNYEVKLNSNEKIPIEGNPRRDIWKKCAWMMADSKKYDEYSRAIVGSLCGHLGSLKSLLSNSWQDLLWGYVKVQIDIRVESELRSSCMKSYNQMADNYWNNKMTLEQIFDELVVAKDAAVRDFAQGHVGVIQQNLILDNVGELLKQMCHWLDDGNNSKISLQELRFLTHIVLFMRQIDRIDHQEAAERIIAAYVEALTLNDSEPQLIAYYASALQVKLQVKLYVKYLDRITDTLKRSSALDAALRLGLDIEKITRQTVEMQRLRTPTESDNELPPQLGEISAFDKRKISSLEWLTFIPEQRGELLWQANAMIRNYMGESKTECVRATFNMVPSDSITHIINSYGSKDDVPYREECSIKEFLCYRTYLDALDGFDDWTRLYHNRPKPPQVSGGEVGKFTERVAHEHKEQNYRIESQRWQTSLTEQTKLTTDLLYNVLLFPEKGWLNDPYTIRAHDDSSQQIWDHRLLQIEKLRSVCIPEIALLLHKVLHQSEDYESCVKMADEIASETRQLYKVYTKHKLAELLSKIADSSLQLLNKQLDPWGFPVTA